MSLEVTLRRLEPDEREGAWRVAQERGVVPCSRDEFHRRCQVGLIAGIVAECRRRYAGLLLYAIHTEGAAVTMMTIVVPPELKRCGIGSALLANLRLRLQAAGPMLIDALVDERDLESQLFLRANGFRAARVLPAAFAGGAADGYCFECRLPAPRLAPRPRSRRKHDPSIE